MPFIQRSGARLHWDQKGAGVPILLIMGHRYSSAMWYPVFEGLGGHRHLIYFDNQGTGQSDARRRTTIGEMADDALAVLDAAGVETAHVYGVSMGGAIAMEFATRNPKRVRSLILGCTLAKTPDAKSMPPWLINLVYRIPRPILRSLMSRKFKGGYGDAAPDDAVARDKAILAEDSFDLRGVIAQALAVSNYTITREQVAALTMPALVLHGTQDLLVPYEKGRLLSEMLPNARLVTYQDIGHNYCVGQGEHANAEVDRFIAKVEAARSTVDGSAGATD